MSKLRKLFIGNSDISPESVVAFKDGQKKLKLMNDQIETMTRAFREGGSISFDELNEYKISTPKHPLKYSTGKNCFAYRLPCEDNNKIVFYCTFEPINGEAAEYGWHNHPDCSEECIQLIGTATVNSEIVKPFGRSVFKSGEYHNYSMKEFGTILVTFTKDE